MNPTAKMVDPNNCATFFDCSSANSRLGPYKQECPYPQLYSASTQLCETFEDTNCYGRYIPIDPCKCLIINKASEFKITTNVKNLVNTFCHNTEKSRKASKVQHF